MNIITFLQYLIAMTESSDKTSIFINTDIFETNLINILVVLFILVYFGRPLITDILSKRQLNISTKIEQSETKRNEAVAKLTEAKNKLAQVELVITQINQEATQMAENIKKMSLAQLEIDIKRIEEMTQENINAQQMLVFNQIRFKIADLIMNEVLFLIKKYLSLNVQSQLVDNLINQLEMQYDTKKSHNF
uniref:ATP synthase CF0 B chain n=1 Tax=Cyanoptyche gloeocystis TaxID=77922 RepID=A0A3G1IWC5_9EUKA|nr:ATP synthase CF0 B chain [Cyanoptyche gloeocystis]